MEKNHATNVKATKLTWAKKCDGFVAFSTKTDPSIPSLNITHEGRSLPFLSLSLSCGEGC